MSDAPTVEAGLNRCVNCGKHAVTVIDSRMDNREGWRRRRRRCMACKATWSTAEVPLAVMAELRELQRELARIRRTIDRVNAVLVAAPLLDEALNVPPEDV